jgi:hypothetical protein
MPCRIAKPIGILSAIIMITCAACGSTANVTIPTSPPPRPTSTHVPTYTPLPTYTPKPTPTRRSVPSPDQAVGNPTQLGPTEAITSTTPVNCVPATITGYNTCVDDTGSLQVDIPSTWTDVNGGTWTYNGRQIGVAISAAPNLDDFKDNFRSEGVFFGASGTFAQIIGHIELLDYYTLAYRENCKFVGRFNYDDGIYRGRYDSYINCGGTGGYDAYVLGAREIKDPSTKLILVEIQAYPGDVSIRDQIWGTFYVYF